MPREKCFSYIMARTSYISMRWWCPLCIWPTWPKLEPTIYSNGGGYFYFENLQQMPLECR